jgi:O-antigen biosynthesis protein WbqP
MYGFFKRCADFLLALAALIILWPVLLITAALIRLTSPGPAVFRQVRAGINGSTFTIYKFRTMYTSAPSDMPTHKLTGAVSYITPLGKFLRRSSLDELPQLFNILKGDMALVGPRPALPTQYDLLKEREKYGANSVRPGLTGWAQINGRDELPIEVKARYDGEYVRRMSLFFDLRCLFGTVGCVFSADGVKEGAHSGKK